MEKEINIEESTKELYLITLEKQKELTDQINPLKRQLTAINNFIATYERIHPELIKLKPKEEQQVANVPKYEEEELDVKIRMFELLSIKKEVSLGDLINYEMNRTGTIPDLYVKIKSKMQYMLKKLYKEGRIEMRKVSKTKAFYSLKKIDPVFDFDEPIKKMGI